MSLTSPVKMLLNQQLREGKWENWLAKIQEYDIEIKPLRAVKGQGLCKLMIGIDASKYKYINFTRVIFVNI
jgi:hypothetical protein